MPETEWDELQRGWMVALTLYEADTCRGCGHQLEDTTDPQRDYNNPLAPYQYEAVDGWPKQCHRCAALDRVQHEVEAQRPQHPGAMKYAVHLTRKA